MTPMQPLFGAKLPAPAKRVVLATVLSMAGLTSANAQQAASSLSAVAAQPVASAPRPGKVTREQAMKSFADARRAQMQCKGEEGCYQKGLGLGLLLGGVMTALGLSLKRDLRVKHNSVDEAGEPVKAADAVQGNSKS